MCACASVFIIFMDDVIGVLKDKCVEEFLLDNLHTILHGNETQRYLFIAKCYILIDIFHSKILLVNLEKSAYMIIHPKDEDLKVDLKIKSGVCCQFSCRIQRLGAYPRGYKSAPAEQRKSEAINFITNNQNALITV